MTNIFFLISLGVQTQLSGKMATIGQAIGSLSHSPSKSTPVFISDAGHPLVTDTTGLIPVTGSNTITSFSAHVASRASLTTSCQLQGMPSFTVVAQSGSSIPTSTPVTMAAGKMIRKDHVLPASIASSGSPSQVNTTVQRHPTHKSTPALVNQFSSIQSCIGEKTTSLLSPPQHTITTTATNIPTTTSVSGTVQQRIVINTSAPLTAGTQILLNNARFVVPPQGLAPGTHVLIITNPAPQVPNASAARTGGSLPPQRASCSAVAPGGSALPQSATRLPGVSTTVVACTPAVGLSSLTSAPSVMPVQLTGSPDLGSTLLHSKTNVVSALPRLPVVQAGNFASGTSMLVSSPPKLGSVPATVISSAPALSSVPATVRLDAGSTIKDKCPSVILPGVAHPLPGFSAPQLHLSSFSSPSDVALSSPIIQVPISISSAVTPQVQGTPLHSSLSAHRVVSVTTSGPGIQPQQTSVKSSSFLTSLSQALVHTGLGKTSATTQMPVVMQPVLAGTRTQVLPTVAVPPIVSAVSRIQTLPVATVPPVGSTVSTFETSAEVTTSTSNRTVIITPAQPITSLKINNTIYPPEILTNQALGKGSLQTSASGIHASVASKLLISPDGAVLSTVQCQANPAEMDALSPNSSTGALHSQDLFFKPSQADAK